MKIKLLALLAASAVAASAQATLVKFGDFQSATARGGNSNFVNLNHLDDGWVAKNFRWGTSGSSSTSFSGEQATSPSDGDGLGQVNSVTTESGTQLKLKFDWTASSAATADALNLSYQVIGWKTPSAPGAGDRLFSFINVRNYGVWNTNGAGNSWANFVDGSTGTFVGNATTAFGTFAGMAGVLKQADITLDLTAFGLGNISDYDYVGIKFNEGTDGSEDIGGGILDNVSLVAMEIPEPASFVSLGLASLGLMALGRRR